MMIIQRSRTPEAITAPVSLCFQSFGVEKSRVVEDSVDVPLTDICDFLLAQPVTSGTPFKNAGRILASHFLTDEQKARYPEGCHISLRNDLIIGYYVQPVWGAIKGGELMGNLVVDDTFLFLRDRQGGQFQPFQYRKDMVDSQLCFSCKPWWYRHDDEGWPWPIFNCECPAFTAIADLLTANEENPLSGLLGSPPPTKTCANQIKRRLERIGHEILTRPL